MVVCLPQTTPHIEDFNVGVFRRAAARPAGDDQIFIKCQGARLVGAV
jgi:hypothetical protein